MSNKGPPVVVCNVCVVQWLWCGLRAGKDQGDIAAAAAGEWAGRAIARAGVGGALFVPTSTKTVREAALQLGNDD